MKMFMAENLLNLEIGVAKSRAKSESGHTADKYMNYSALTMSSETVVELYVSTRFSQ